MAETATPKMRGLLGACVQLMVALKNKIVLITIQTADIAGFSSYFIEHPNLDKTKLFLAGGVWCDVGDSDGSCSELEMGLNCLPSHGHQH